MLRNDPDPSARCWAAYALADLVKTGRRDGGGWAEEKPTPWYTPAAAAEILALLRGSATSDPSDAVRVSAAFGIGFLRNEPGDSRNFRSRPKCLSPYCGPSVTAG
jgi:hypothetical protein